MRILIIESNAKQARTLKASLEEHGYAVDVAATDQTADEIAVLEPHDVIILGATPRSSDGLDLCRHLRRRGVRTPILMLSVLVATADKVAGLDAGADDYVVSPCQADELMARLRSLMRRPAATASAILSSGDLVMNLDEHRATLRGEPLRLSAKEFALLEYMLRNPKRLLTRAMIAESVWDMNYEVGSNVIDVYVSSLRRKIGSAAGRPRIETVIGSGYRLVGPEEAGDHAASASP